jgi:hypothetical protein
VKAHQAVGVLQPWMRSLTAFTTSSPRKYTFDRSMLIHKVNLFDLHHKYADVLHLDGVLDHLEALAMKREVA